QLEAPFGRRFGFEANRELDVDAVRRKNDVLVFAFENGFPQLITQLLDGVSKWYLQFCLPFREPKPLPAFRLNSNRQLNLNCRSTQKGAFSRALNILKW